ncbi:hypothetical protein T01_8888, partial [Trichinella spiralis]
MEWITDDTEITIYSGTYVDLKIVKKPEVDSLLNDM